MLYFWQTGCPYCNALVEQNFAQRDIVETMQSNYQLVGINMWGDREVIQVGGKVFTEKTLAAALQVNYTPRSLFFDEARKVKLRLNGCYPPDDLESQSIGRAPPTAPLSRLLSMPLRQSRSSPGQS